MQEFNIFILHVEQQITLYEKKDLLLIKYNNYFKNEFTKELRMSEKSYDTLKKLHRRNF